MSEQRQLCSHKSHLCLQVDTINSVQFSNHTGYSAGVRGQILDDSQLQELIDGLDANNINSYSHIINGYIGSRWG